MTLKYESVLLFDLMKRDGDDAPSDVLPYESELKEKYLNQVVGAYPKLQDYQPEWLYYNLYHHLPSDFPVESVANVTSASFYNVVPYVYKSAILSGQTLVNLLDTEMLKDDNNINAVMGVTLDKDYFISDHTDGQVQISKDNKSPLEGKLMDGKTYTLVLTVNTTDKTSDGADVYLGLDTTTHTTGIKFLDNANGVVKIKFTPSVKETPSTSSRFQIGFYNRAVVKISRKIMVLEGDYTNQDIPYFEGMQSVKLPVLKTTGKNLTPVNHARLDGIDANTGKHVKNLIGKNIPVTPGKTYTVSYSVSSSTNVQAINITRYEHQEKTNSNNHEQLWNEIGKDDGNLTFTIPQGINYISFTFGNAIYTNDGTQGWIQFDNIQLEEGSVATEYEPYKSNILTVNEDVTLRSNGGICDELNLLTGQLTQRIDEDGEVLSQEVVKKLDLSCINEQGESATFRPIEGTMHVNTSSQALPPLLDMSVPVEATTQNLMSFANIEEEE